MYESSLSLTIGIVNFVQNPIPHQLLKSLVRQLNNNLGFRVHILINGADHDPNGARNHQTTLSKRYPEFDISILGTNSLSAARNVILKDVSSEYLLFLDDDCIITPSFIKLLSKALTKAMPDLFGGPILLQPQASISMFERYRRSFARPSFRQLGVYLCGGNIGVRTQWAKKIGGFNERLGLGTRMSYGEDTELMLRAMASGAKIAFLSRLFVYHPVKSKDMSEHTDFTLDQSRRNDAIDALKARYSHKPLKIGLLRFLATHTYLLIKTARAPS